MIPRFLERSRTWTFFLVAMPYTLLHQPALAELPLCLERSTVVIGAVFASGILARPGGGRALRLPAGRARGAERTRDRRGLRAAKVHIAAQPSSCSTIPAVARAFLGQQPAGARQPAGTCASLPGGSSAELKAERLIGSGRADALLARPGARRSRKLISLRCSSSQSANWNR